MPHEQEGPYPSDVGLFGLGADSSPEEQAAKRVAFSERSGSPRHYRRPAPRRHFNWGWDKPKASSLIEYSQEAAPSTLMGRYTRHHAPADEDASVARTRPRRSARPPDFELMSSAEEARHLERRKEVCNQKAHLLAGPALKGCLKDTARVSMEHGQQHSSLTEPHTSSSSSRTTSPSPSPDPYDYDDVKGNRVAPDDSSSSSQEEAEESALTHGKPASKLPVRSKNAAGPDPSTSSEEGGYETCGEVPEVAPEHPVAAAAAPFYQSAASDHSSVWRQRPIAYTDAEGVDYDSDGHMVDHEPDELYPPFSSYSYAFGPPRPPTYADLYRWEQLHAQSLSEAASPETMEHALLEEEALYDAICAEVASNEYQLGRYITQWSINALQPSGIALHLLFQHTINRWRRGALEAYHPALPAEGLRVRSRNASGPDEVHSTPEPHSHVEVHAARHLRAKLKAIIVEQNNSRIKGNLTKALASSPDKAIPVPSPAPRSKGCKRKALEVTPEMQDRITEKLMEADTSKQGRLTYSRQCDYEEFARKEKWDPLIEDPTNTVSQYRLKRWIAFEKFEKKNKASTIEQKLPAINQYHTDRGKLPPFKYALAAREYLTKLKKLDPPAQPRLPVPPELTTLYLLNNDPGWSDSKPWSDAAEWDVKVTATCMNTHRDWCMRSAEGMAPDSGPPDPRSLQWRDVMYKVNHTRVTGAQVRDTSRITLSLRSTKNALGRCTRTVPVLNDIPNSGAVMLRELYLEYIQRYGCEPPSHELVFTRANGQPVRRGEISSLIQTLMLSVGVPKHLVGSHSLRRGGASQYLAAQMPEAKIKAFGRWTSDAYKLYLIIDTMAVDAYARKAATAQPRFEL